MSTVLMEEGDFPDSKENKLDDTEITKSTVATLGKMVFRTHGQAEQLQAQFDDMKSQMRNEKDQGPSVDYNRTEEILERLYRAIRNWNPPPNGDVGSNAWHLALAVIALAMTIVGATWMLAGKLADTKAEVVTVSGKVDVSVSQISDIKETLREEHERINRLEDEQRRLGDRFRANPAP